MYRRSRSQHAVFVAVVLAGFVCLSADTLHAQTVINVPPDPAPGGIGADTVLNLFDEGVLLDNFQALDGSAVNVTGGSIGDNFEAVGAVVTISGGELGEYATFLSGTSVAVTGGLLGGKAHAIGADIVISGGTIGRALSASAGSRVTMTGGEVEGLDLRASVADVRGGYVSNLTNLQNGAVLNISDAGIVDDVSHISGGSTINIDGGSLDRVGRTFYDSTLNISGDALVYSVVPSTGAVVNISGGAIWGDLDPRDGSHVTITGGAIAGGFESFTGSSVDIHGFDYRIDGVPLEGLDTPGQSMPVDIPADSVFSGNYADGTPFAYYSLGYNQQEFADGTLTLRRSEVPAAQPLINVPNDPVPGGIRSGQTMYVTAGGVVPGFFRAGRGSELNVDGGDVGWRLEAVGAVINLDSGTIGRGFVGLMGTTLNVNGGAIDEYVRLVDSVLNFGGGTIGYECFVYDTIVNVTGGVIEEKFTAFSGSTVNLTAGQIGEEFTLQAGAVLNVLGGVVTSDRDSFLRGSVINVDGGRIDWLSVEGILNVNSGSVGDRVPAYEGAQVTINGGDIGLLFRARQGADVVINGGRIDEDFRADSGSTVTINGGTFGDEILVEDGAGVTFRGSFFQVDGVDVAGLVNEGDSVALDVPYGSQFTGTLADGTSFAFSSRERDEFKGTVTLVKTDVPTLDQPVINVPAQEAPIGTQRGQALYLDEGGALGDHFTAGPGSSVFINDGTVGKNFEAIDATVVIDGGYVGSLFDAFGQSDITVTGGEVAGGFTAYPGSTVHVSGGVVGGINATGAQVDISGGNAGAVGAYDSVVDISDDAVLTSFRADDGTVANISGGTIEDGFTAEAGSDVWISGGTLGGRSFVLGGAITTIAGGNRGDRLFAWSDAALHFFGTDFSIDGDEVAGLENPGDSVVVGVRGGALLQAGLLDGSIGDYQLNHDPVVGEDRILEDAIVILHLFSPEATSGDANGDRVIDALDYLLWADHFGATDLPTEMKGPNGGDFNLDGRVDGLDYLVWVANFGTGMSAAVPEPGTLVTFPVGVLSLVVVRRRRVCP